MSKVVANRLKAILNDVISPMQSAFIPNRLINDDLLIAFEVGHYLKRRRLGRVGYGALKVDMSMAYDRVEWDYLRSIMIKLGFLEEFISLVMLFVMSVWYQISHESGDFEKFTPHRGIRQGDPLSLFLSCYARRVCPLFYWII